METEKLYYADPFLTDFTATVLDCQPGKNGYLVTLDRTAFYPEGGGQPADHGVLDGAAVTDVHEKNGVILHNVDRAVEIGKTVTGAIDWGRRFDHMQQHSGEHICSGLICERFHCDNVGFHMGADVVVAVDVLGPCPETEKIPNLIALVTRVYDIMDSHRTSDERRRNRRCFDLWLTPDIGDLSQYTIKYSEEAIEAGYKAGKENAEKIRRLLED